MDKSQIKWIIDKIINCAKKDSCEETNCAYFYYLHELEKLAEYFDDTYIDIVRCKHCKWYDKGANESDSWALCKLTNGRYDVHDDFFCANGEETKDD